MLAPPWTPFPPPLLGASELYALDAEPINRKNVLCGRDSRNQKLSVDLFYWRIAASFASCTARRSLGYQ
jgi:hypothetical protein